MQNITTCTSKVHSKLTNIYIFFQVVINFSRATKNTLSFMICIVNTPKHTVCLQYSDVGKQSNFVCAENLFGNNLFFKSESVQSRYRYCV